METPPQAEVRGHRAYRKKACAWLLAGAYVIDLSLIFTSFAVFLLATHAEKNPGPLWLLQLSVISAVYFAVFKLTGGRTPGARGWQLRRLGHTPLLQREQITGGAWIGGIALTTIFFLLTIFTYQSAIFQYPLWQTASPLEWDSYFPTEETGKPWTPLPFFYALGTWPSQYQDNPVLYRLPYEKGPPQRFVGHVIALWNAPAIQVTFEGPKTPFENYSRRQIHDCLTARIPLTCLGLRKKILARHTDELSENEKKIESFFLRPTWKLQWFTIKNPALPPEEQIQGFAIRTRSNGSERHRFVLITPRGIHQAFTLDTTPNPEGLAAYELFEKSLRSLRTSDELSSGTAWIDQRLEGIHLGDLTAIQDPAEMVRKYTEIQALLLAKITVEPKLYDTYYHLAGVSLTLARYLAELQEMQATHPVPLPPLPFQDIISASQGLIESAYRYALDVSPTESRNLKLKDYLNQAGTLKH